MSKSKSPAGVSLLSQLSALSHEVQLANVAHAKLDASMSKTQALLKKCELL
jgi:hypothetical protein